MIAPTLAWLLLSSGAPAEAATDAASAPAGAQALGRPVVAKDVARESGVLLNVGPIVTASAEAEALRAPVGSFEGKRLHLVQFAGPIQPEWYQDLEATGAEVIRERAR